MVLERYHDQIVRDADGRTVGAITLYEITNAVDLDLKQYIEDDQKRVKAEQVRDTEKAERAQFERLKAKFGTP
jgi:hypothetical protein